MKNADKPISPLTSGESNQFLCDLGNDEHFIKNANPLIGLTKREYFAAMAMQGLLHQAAHLDRIVNDQSQSMTKQIAKASVIISDALLAELDKPINY